MPFCTLNIFTKALIHDTLKTSRYVMSKLERYCSFSEWGDEDSLSQRSCGFWQSSYQLVSKSVSQGFSFKHSLRGWGERAFKILQTCNNKIDTNDYALFYRWNRHRQIYINETRYLTQRSRMKRPATSRTGCIYAPERTACRKQCGFAANHCRHGGIWRPG